MTDSISDEELQKKVRRLFVNRTHIGGKIAVRIPKEMQIYKTAIIPYEPTVEKIVQLIKADRQKLLTSILEDKQTATLNLGQPLKAEVVRVDYIKAKFQEES